MANKKQYYKNRNRRPAKPAENNSAMLTQYSSEQLTLTLEDLGVSEATVALMKKNRINLASDLVVRTEKDMYRVQGLNKKILLEINDCLKKQGMTLRPDDVVKVKADEQAVAPKQNAQKQAKAQKQDKADKTDASVEKGSKFGLADKKSTKDKAQKQDNKPQKQDKTKKVEKESTPILQKGDWRKVMKGGKWGYSDGSKIVIPTMYDEIFAFKEDLASVEIDEKCGYIDKENNVVIPLDYETAMSFSEGLAMVVKGGKCGYINRNNEVIIPFEYDAATPFEDGEAKVKKDGKWGTLTPDNKISWI